MGMDDALLGKAAVVAREVARGLIMLRVGERIPGTAEYAQAHDVGFGTVQKALASLVYNGAIKISSQASRGTFLVAKNASVLWRAAHLPAVTGMLPLPSSPEHEGLASALTITFEELGIPFTLSYTQGARQRIRALLERRCDVIVLSADAATAASAENADFVPLLDLPDCQYYKPGALIVLMTADAARHGPLRVGVDRSSYDHEMLTRHEFPDALLIPVHYTHIPQSIARGVIDAAIWNETARGPLTLGASLCLRPLAHQPARDLAARLGSVTLLGRRGSVGVAALFRDYVDGATLGQIQREVIDGARIPSY